MMHDIEDQKILIVDDRPENILALECALEDLELYVVAAQSGKEALSLLREHDVAVVLLDVQMPEMNGFEVAERIRETEKTKYLPIIFITAISIDEKYIARGYESGAVDYITKPINEHFLISKVKVFCELYNQRATIQKQLDKISELKGLLPICSNCKKIRNDEGYWEIIESYIMHHSKAEFTHGICPACVKILYPELS